jgi:succinate dehydrogenase flavin-adding protein (antitoxin of CptAB toxin-antitoxin module)
VRIRRDKSRLSVRIEPKGIDLLDGALSVRGVEKSSSRYSRLGYKKEIRRGILVYCYSFHEFFNEDTEILQEFRQSGFSNLLIEEVRYHMWYLNKKSLLELKTPDVEDEVIFLARITARGMDVLDNNESEPGVSHD